MTWSRWPLLFLIGSILFIAFATLVPAPPLTQSLPAYCLVCGEYGGIDLTLNIILFVPYGAALYLVLRKPWLALAIAMASTLAIELLQLSVISGRDSSLGDLVSNSLGGAIGVLLAKHWRFWIVPDPRQATRLAVYGWLAWICILALSAWALQPSPTASSWFVQESPDLAHFAKFRGTLVSAAINDERVSSGFLDANSPIYERLTKGAVAVTPVVIAGLPADRSKIAPILSIFDRQQREILLTGQKGTDFVFRLRTNTSTLRMREPTIGLSQVFPGDSKSVSQIGDTITLRAERSRSGVVLSATSPSATPPATHLEAKYSWHIFMLWNALLPFDFALTPGTHILSALWALGLIVLPVYWSASTRRSRWLWVGGAVMIVVLTAVPLSFGYPLTPWWGWVGTIFGGLAGMFLRKLHRRRWLLMQS